MGDIIGIWSPYHRTGRTTITLALAFKMLENLAPDKKVLICCANGSRGTLLKTAGIKSEEIGIDDLVSYKQAGFSIGEYSNILPKKGRLFFAGSTKMTPYFIKSHTIYFEKLFDDLKDQFDVVLIDMPDRSDNLLINIIRDKCRIVAVLDQDAERVKDAELGICGKDTILVINKYQNLYPTRTEIKDLCSYKGDIYCVSNCNILREMLNKGKLSQYCTMESDFNLQIRNLAFNLLGTDRLTRTKEKPSDAATKKLFGRLKTSMLGGEHG